MSIVRTEKMRTAFVFGLMNALHRSSHRSSSAIIYTLSPFAPAAKVWMGNPHTGSPENRSDSFKYYLAIVYRKKRN